MVDIDPTEIRNVAILAIVLLFGLAAFTGWLLRQYESHLKAQITDREKQRDVQIEINKSQADINRRVAERLDDLFDVISTRRSR